MCIMNVDYNYWIEYFLNMNEEQMPLLNNGVYQGNIPKEAIQFNEPLFVQQLFVLKQKIGSLTESAQLNYLNTLSINHELPNFSGDERHLKIAQSFYQSDNNYFEFIEAYKKHLKENMINDFYKDIHRNIYSRRYAKEGHSLNEYIEDKHSESKYKDERFYKHLVRALIIEGANDYQKKLFNEVYEYCEKKIKNFETPVKTETKQKPITANVLGIFCSLINETEIDVLKDGESYTSYCERICKKYNLYCTPKSVRKYFNYQVEFKGKNLKRIEIIQKQILPTLPTNIKDIIEQLIANKTKTFA